MSIENLLADLTAALKANTEALLAASGAAKKTSTPAQDAADDENAAPAPKKTRGRKPAAAADDADDAPAPAKKKSSITLDDLQKLVKTFTEHDDDKDARTGRVKKVKAALQSFGAETLSDKGKGDKALDESDYSAFKKKVEALIASLDDAEDEDDEDL